MSSARSFDSTVGLDELLQFITDQKGSDLHLKVGSRPHVRIDGSLTPTPFAVLTPADVERMAYAILPPNRAAEFEATNEADFAIGITHLGRFRVNVYRQRGTIAMARTMDPHSATAQFFINIKDNSFLNHSSKSAQGWGYCVFGKVTKGMDVVTKIKNVKTGSNGMHQDVPVETVVIEGYDGPQPSDR